LSFYDHLKDFWSEFFAEIKSLVTLRDPLFLRLLCLDKEYKEANVDVELQVEVTGGSKINNLDRIITTAAARAVTVIFNGCYRKGDAVRRALPRWLEVNRYGLDGMMFNTPHFTNLADPDPDHWLNKWGFKMTQKRDNPDQTGKLL
jgi:hypothetical protein